MTVSTERPHRSKTPVWVKVGIETFALAVGLVLLIVIDHVTGWIGIT